MGKCFSIEKTTPISTIRTTQPPKVNRSDVSASYEVGMSPKVSTRAYEIIDKDILHLYKISVSSITSRDSSTNLARKDPSIHRGESYQNLRKTYFVDTRS